MATRTRDAVLVVLGAVPVGVEFGIDCATYELGPRFRGVCGVPAGLHFLHQSAGLGPRQGFFLRARHGELLLCSWDAANEQIVPRHDLSAEAIGSLQAAIERGELDASLGPYPMGQHSLWQNISCFVTDEVLGGADCLPGSLVYPGDELDEFDMKLTDVKKLKQHARSEAVKPYFAGTARVARFTEIQRADMAILEGVRSSPNSGAHITAMMMDKSYLLRHLVKSEFGQQWAGLLGEMQLSFLLFMLIYSYPGLQQWKLILNTIAGSEQFLHESEAFTASFMKTLFCQLKFSPDDFFEAELSRDNFLRPVLTSLFSSLSGPIVRGDGGEAGAMRRSDVLVEHRERLRKFVGKKFNLFVNSAEADCGDGDGGGGGGSGGDMEVSVDEWSLQTSGEDRPTVVSAAEFAAAMTRLDDTPPQVKSIGTIRLETVEPSPASVRWQELDKALQSVGAKEAQDTTAMVPEEQHPPPAPAPAEPCWSNQQPPMSVYEKEIGMFSWRYPLLYEASMRSHRQGASTGPEDMTMAAARIVAEADEQASDAQLATTALYLEAVMFIQCEVALKKTAQ